MDLVIIALEHISKVRNTLLSGMATKALADRTLVDEVCSYIYDQYYDGENFLQLIKNYGEEHIDNIMDYIEPKKKHDVTNIVDDGLLVMDDSPERTKELNDQMKERLGFTSDLQREWLEKNIPSPAIGMMIMDWYYTGDEDGWKRLDNPKDKYVVLSGDPMYGMQIPKEVPYINHLPDAEKVFNDLMTSEGCAVLYKLTTQGMELVKSDTNL